MAEFLDQKCCNIFKSVNFGRNSYDDDQNRFVMLSLRDPWEPSLYAGGGATDQKTQEQPLSCT